MSDNATELEIKADTPGPAPARDMRRHPWVVFLAPFVVYMAVGAFEPTRNATGPSWLGLEYAQYPVVYSLKILLTVVAMVFVWPGYRQFAFKVHPVAVVVGVLGAGVWIGLCSLRLEEMLGWSWLLDLGARSAYDPIAELGHSPWGYGFLAIRLLGLVVVVAWVEEFFLRGFLMRFVMEAEWWTVPFGKASGAAIVAGTVFPALLHPAEAFAALAWFSGVTVLMVRTRTMWDCVLAHMVTNLLLGVYVIVSGDWRLV